MKENTTSSGIFAVGWDDTMFDSYNSTNTKVQEIWSSDNQLYGIIIRPKSYNTVVPKQVDENAIQLIWQRTGGEYYNE